MEDKNLKKAYIALAAICVIWGTTFFAMKVGVQEYPPLLLLAMRQGMAGIILWTLAKLNNVPSPSKKDFIHIAIIGLLIVLFPGIMAPLPLKNISSGLLALINAFVPISVVFINLLFRKGRDLNLMSVIGIVFGLAGMFFLYQDNIKEFSNTNYLWGFILCFISAFSAGGGLVYGAALGNKIHPLYSAGYQYLISAVPLFGLSLAFEKAERISFYSHSTVALLYVTIMGSVIALPAYLYALTKLPTTLVSIYAYINPVIALTIGFLFLNEKLNENIFIAAGCILCGVYLINKSHQKIKAD